MYLRKEQLIFPTTILSMRLRYIQLNIQRNANDTHLLVIHWTWDSKQRLYTLNSSELNAMANKEIK